MESTKKSIKNITFLLSGITKGGSERVVSILSNTYAAQGINVNVISMQNVGCFYNFHQDVKINYLNEARGSYKNPLKIFNNIFKLSKIINDSKADMVVAFGESTSIYSIFSKFFTGKKTTVCIRQDPNGVNKYIIFLVKIFYSFADLLILQTKHQKNWSDERWPNLPKKILNNPLIFNQKINLYSEKNCSIDFLFPATIKWEKNHDDLILAFNKIKNKLPKDVKMYFAGRFFTKEIAESITNLINDLNLTDRIVIMGNVEDIESVYKKTKIFVMSSTNEGMPNALLEAMSFGIPCVSTAWPGVDDIIQHNKDGLIAPMRNSEELSNHMLKLYNDFELRKKMGNQAFLKIQKNYNTEIVSKKWLDALSEV